MDSYSDSLLRSLAATAAALWPNAGASVAVYGGHGEALAERARAGALTALAHLPPAGHTWAGKSSVTEGLGTGWYVIGAGLQGRDRRPLGLLRLVIPQRPRPALLTAVEALAAHAAVVLEQAALHHELQHSFNQLFIVYEAGRLLNLSHTPAEVLDHVIGLLVRTLHFPHCAVLLLEEGALVPAAHAGLDPRWATSARIPLEETFAARVLDAGAAAQFEDVADLEGLTLPLLETGQAPACLLCAPLTTRTGPLGFLEVYHVAPEPFSDDELFVVSVLAVEMAAALENARLYETLREREERLTQYAAKLVNSQEEERRRISRDIHDGLGQMIVSAFQYLQAHEYSLPQGHPREAFQRGLAVLEECIAETRRVMSDLRPSTLDDFGLVVALQQQLDAAAAEAGWQAQYEVTGAVTRLAPAVETTIFRVVQEALSNARKHAQSDRLHVTLARQDDTVLVEVRDWGRGFDVERVVARPERGEHLGLMGMRERVALLGGTVAIDSAPGAGTTVRIMLPVN
jgi:signal transduction histidine kinase